MDIRIEVIITCCLVGILTFTWRYLLTLNRGKNFLPDDDNVVHHYFIKMFSMQPHHFKITKDERFVLCPYTSYPQFFHKLMASLLGFDRFLKFKQSINPVLDALFNMVFFVFSYFFIFGPGMMMSKTGQNGLLLAFITSILYLFSPLMIFFEARVINFGERLFSYIIGMLSIISVILYLNTKNIAFLLPAVFFNVLVIFSSQFTTQVILFFHLFSSIFMQDVFPFLTVLSAWGVSFSIAPRIMVSFIKAKYLHIRWYYRALKNKTHDIAFLYRNLLPRMIVYGLPYLLAAVYIKDIIPLSRQPLFQGITVYCIGSICTFILIYLPVFRPFGEAVRYLEYSLPFVIITLVYTCALNNRWIILGILMTVNLLSTFHYILKFNLKTPGNPSWESMIRFLNKHEDRTLITIPLKLSYFISTHTNNKMVNAMLLGSDYTKIESIRKKTEYPIDDFHKIKHDYPFDWIVCRKGYESSYNFSRMRIVFRDSEYIIYEL
jgi:hypothetical protein